MNTEFEDYIEYIKNFHKDASEIVEKKCVDYAGKEDPLRNFRDAALLAGVTVEQGMLVRMADKIARIRNLTAKKDSLGEVGEKLEDTLMDLSNYASILSYYCASTYKDQFFSQMNLFEEKDDIPVIEALPVEGEFPDLPQNIKQIIKEETKQEEKKEDKKNWFKEFVGI